MFGYNKVSGSLEIFSIKYLLLPEKCNCPFLSLYLMLAFTTLGWTETMLMTPNCTIDQVFIRAQLLNILISLSHRCISSYCFVVLTMSYQSHLKSVIFVLKGCLLYTLIISEIIISTPEEFWLPILHCSSNWLLHNCVRTDQ